MHFLVLYPIAHDCNRKTPMGNYNSLLNEEFKNYNEKIIEQV